jgi:hypothetical protein
MSTGDCNEQLDNNRMEHDSPNLVSVTALQAFLVRRLKLQPLAPFRSRPCLLFRLHKVRLLRSRLAA